MISINLLELFNDLGLHSGVSYDVSHCDMYWVLIMRENKLYSTSPNLTMPWIMHLPEGESVVLRIFGLLLYYCHNFVSVIFLVPLSILRCCSILPG